MDEYVSDTQIDIIDDAHPEVKQNDQVRINTAQGTKKGTKNCLTDEMVNKIDPRVSCPKCQNLDLKFRVLRKVETRTKIQLIEECFILKPINF